MVLTLREALGAQLIETHISYVLIAGADAWKIKKALDLGFADFSTLALRRYFCDEELRLNRRTAPQLYLDVQPLTGSVQQPVVGGAGPALDWVLHMRAFAQDGLWDRLASRGALGAAQIDALVEALCELHRAAAVAGPDSAYRPARACARADERQPARAGHAVPRRRRPRRSAASAPLGRAGLRRACARSSRSAMPAAACARPMATCTWATSTQIDGRTVLFDCLEFSADLRWTDVFSDVAFMAMDLRSHGLDALSHRFVNAYVERSGDAEGLRVLRYYRVHRALVRAKVAALRAAQLADAAAQGERQALHHYLQQALDSSHPPRPVLMLTHGFSGSGKTVATQGLLEACGAIRFRADVERKRLFGLDPLQRSDAAHAGAAVFEPGQPGHAAALARPGGAGAAKRLQRHPRCHLPGARGAAAGTRAGRRAWVCVSRSCISRPEPDTLRERVRQRAQRRDDASEADLAVLESQLLHAQPLQDDELGDVMTLDAEQPLQALLALQIWAPLQRRLGWIAR